MLSIKSTTAAILAGSGQPLVIDEIYLPSELKAGQVLVEVITSGVCGAQINEIDAVKGPDKFLPHLLGHEGFARVIEIGPGVIKINPGDCVIMHWRPSSGIQSVPALYEWRGKILNAGWVTTFNNHAVVSENRLTKIEPGSHDKQVLPLLGCALTTAFGVLKNDSNASSRDSVLVFGSGGVGLAIIEVAKIFDIKDIVIVDINEEKLLYASKLGANLTVKFTSKADVLHLLKKIYSNYLPTIAIDTTGNTDAIEVCYEVSASNARVILVGVPKVGTKVSIYTLPLHFEKILKGSEGGHSKPEKDIPYLLNLIKDNKLSFKDYPTHSFSINEINEAISQLKSGVAGRMIIDFTKI